MPEKIAGKQLCQTLQVRVTSNTGLKRFSFLIGPNDVRYGVKSIAAFFVGHRTSFQQVCRYVNCTRYFHTNSQGTSVHYDKN